MELKLEELMVWKDLRILDLLYSTTALFLDPFQVLRS